MTRSVTVHKLDACGREVWSYPGVVLQRGPDWLRLEGRFNRDDVHLPGLTLGRGDRMLETFYTGRWYNVFEVRAAGDDRLKGWYCNIARPARLEADDVYADDLALDVIVYPDGQARVVDEDEFRALGLDVQEQGRAWRAVDEIRSLAARREAPFAARS